MNLKLDLDDEASTGEDDCEISDSTYRETDKFGQKFSFTADRVRFNGLTVGDSGLRPQLKLGKRLGT